MTIRLVRTSTSCPEQYEAFMGTEEVGYLRLRYGYFEARVPDAGGNVVYRTATEGWCEFEEHERDHHLRKAVRKIRQSIRSRDQQYTIEEGRP